MSSYILKFGTQKGQVSIIKGANKHPKTEHCTCLMLIYTFLYPALLGDKRLQKIQSLPHTYTHTLRCVFFWEEGQKVTFKSRERTQ